MECEKRTGKVVAGIYTYTSGDAVLKAPNMNLTTPA
jgi:hypothetical protein